MMNTATNPTVSVIIPAYNAAPWIAETIDSVLNQTFQDFEVIVVDDGSTDGTAEIVKNYKSQVQYLYKNNGGVGSARNTGIRAARGRYIACVDADDLWLPEKLEVQTQLLQTEPSLAWVYSDGLIFENNSNQNLHLFSPSASMISGDVLRPLLLQDFIPCPTPVIRRDIFENVGFFEEDMSLQSVADWDMWLRISAKYPVGFIDKPLVKYRRHSTSMTSTSIIERSLKSRLTVIEGAILRDPERLGNLRQQAIANIYMTLGHLVMSRGNRLEAREMYLHSIQMNSKQLKSIIYLIATFLPISVNQLKNLRRYLQNLELSV
jgi:glycosyltransferase involved in cell wall biosynthesis